MNIIKWVGLHTINEGEQIRSMFDDGWGKP